MSSRRTFTREFKLQVLEEVDAGIPVKEVCKRYDVSNDMVYRWRGELKSTTNPFGGRGVRTSERAKIAEMERIIGRQAVEIDFLKNALKRLKGIEP
jgi:transposase-like protein